MALGGLGFRVKGLGLKVLGSRGLPGLGPTEFRGLRFLDLRF